MKYYICTRCEHCMFYQQGSNKNRGFCANENHTRALVKPKWFSCELGILSGIMKVRIKSVINNAIYNTLVIPFHNYNKKDLKEILQRLNKTFTSIHPIIKCDKNESNYQ